MPESSRFLYVYLLVSLPYPTRHYTGITRNLASRLQSHNSGQVPHTSKFRPWKVETAVAFRSKEKAYAFEAYLKTRSGRTFARKRF